MTEKIYDITVIYRNGGEKTYFWCTGPQIIARSLNFVHLEPEIEGYAVDGIGIPFESIEMWHARVRTAQEEGPAHGDNIPDTATDD